MLEDILTRFVAGSPLGVLLFSDPSGQGLAPGVSRPGLLAPFPRLVPWGFGTICSELSTAVEAVAGACLVGRRAAEDKYPDELIIKGHRPSTSQLSSADCAQSFSDVARDMVLSSSADPRMAQDAGSLR